MKCRQYKFRFAECGHITEASEWIFHWPGHAEKCELEEVIYERPQYCFECLSQEQLPIWRRNFYPQAADKTIYFPIFKRFVEHHRDHAEGLYHFTKHDLRALWVLSGSLTEVDRLYIKEVEEACDDALWAYSKTKNFIEGGQGSSWKENFRILRNIVLQLRFAHLTSLVQRIEFVRYDEQQVDAAKVNFLKRSIDRVLALLSPVEKAELSEDDNCPICYQGLLELAKVEPASKDAPVRLPCGHLFSKTCILKWLQDEAQTCPYCRTDFLLTEEDDADWMEVVDDMIDDGFVSDDAERATPWWIKMIRGEKFVQG